MDNMKKDKSFRSEIASALHEMMRDACDAGVVSHTTARTFDEVCLASAPGLAADESDRP